MIWAREISSSSITSHERSPIATCISTIEPMIRCIAWATCATWRIARYNLNNMNDTSQNADARIEQFRKMANDDPSNELGHFSLGRALLEVGKFDEAAQAMQRVLALNPNIGKAYQLLAEAQLKTN